MAFWKALPLHPFPCREDREDSWLCRGGVRLSYILHTCKNRFGPVASGEPLAIIATVELENDPDVVAAIAEIELARKRTEEIRKKTRLRRFKDTIKEWAALSSYAGINHMGEAKNWGTLLFWSIFVLLSLILFFYLLVITLSQYLSYRTTVDLKLPNAQGDFPAVTICNMNAYKKSAVMQDPTLRALVRLYLKGM